jgi:hypothetical protein
VAWTGAAAPLDPGGFVTATWHVVAHGDPGVVVRTVAGWLRAANLSFTLRRAGTTSRFELAPAARRKRVVSAVSCHATAGGAEIEVVLHPKADMPALVTVLEGACGQVVATSVDYRLTP